MQAKITGPDDEKLNPVLAAIKARLPQSISDLLTIAADGTKLTLTWKEQPTPFAVGICKQAWEAVHGGAAMVEHVVADGGFYARMVADTAAQAIHAVMTANQSKHGDSWLTRDDSEDLEHAKGHLERLLADRTAEEDLTHCLTRLGLVLARRKLKGLAS